MRLGRKPRSADADLLKAEKELTALNRELAWELSKAAVDVAGLVDPTPISDAVSMGMSLIDGDYIGAGLSLISMVPYAGDALAKTTKGARVAKKIIKLQKKIAALTTKVRALRSARTAKTAKTVRRVSKTANKLAKNQNGVCIDCQKRAKETIRPSAIKRIHTSKKKLDAARKAAVRKAWKQERDLAATGAGRGTRAWTRAERQELLKTGKVKGYEGHHINNVADHPHLAGNPNNIEFVRRSEHLKRHGGNWRNSTKGKLLKRR